MVKEIQIGEQTIKFKVMASTDRYFLSIFGVDPIVEQGNHPGGMKAGEFISFMEKMAFVMAKQAEFDDPAKMLDLTATDYIRWADTIERTDLLAKIGELRDLYEWSRTPMVPQKKRADD